jgi:argininosuccinate lyase
MKMWAGRINQASNPEFEKWQRSFGFDQRLLPYEVRASKAHASALLHAGVLTPQECASIRAALDQIQPPSTDDPSIEDVHHYVESELVKLVGDLGLKLHTCRSRNEQIATDLRLYLRDRSDSICASIAELISAFLDQAEHAGNAVMPSYTHLQRAEPVLVAHWLLAYTEMFLRDIARLQDCRTRLNQCPLGSGAIAGAFLPLDREAIATELGFDGVTANSMDATSDRDFAIEFVQCANLLAVHLSRMAEEMILFSTSEYGFLRLPDQFSTGSSAMPQKKNPDALELIRGKCGRITGNSVALLMTCKGLPLAYNKDLQETQLPLFDTAEQCAGLLSVAAGFIRSVQFDFARMQQASESGQMNATAAAAHLVMRGVPFRRAHELIGRAVRVAIDSKCELEQLTAEQFASIGIDADHEFYASLAIARVVDSHDVPGGTSPARVAEALAAARNRLASLSGAAHVCA